MIADPNVTVTKEAGDRLKAGDLVYFTSTGRAFKARKNRKPSGIVVRGGAKGKDILVRVQGIAVAKTAAKAGEPVALELGIGKMTPGPYTTCRKCKALVAVSDVRNSSGYCGNCYPQIVTKTSIDKLAEYRRLVGRLTTAMVAPSPTATFTLGDALRELVYFHVRETDDRDVRIDVPETFGDDERDED